MPDLAPSRGRRTVLLAIYLALLAASQIVQWTTNPWYTPPPDWLGEQVIEIPKVTRDGPIPGTSMRLAYIDWQADAERNHPPVILLHGSPGQALDWTYTPNDEPNLASRLNAAGYRVIAIDLPGFGNSSKWIPDYSSRAHAHAVLELMDALTIDRAHVIGWSNGGGVALNIADIAPERLATLTLLASIGAQETEGSGSYFFEHLKYAVGYAAVVVLPECIPHFGALADLGFRHAFIRNFMDSDQRPLREIMANLETPTLILHGRDDFLTPAWGAIEHNTLIPTSRLVLLDADHFIPFTNADDAATYTQMLFTRHANPGVAPRAGIVYDVLPRKEGRIEIALRGAPWWGLVILIALAAAWRPEATAAACGVLVGLVWIDFGVAFAGLWLAMLELHARATRPDAETSALWAARTGARPAHWAMALRFRPWERRVGIAAGRQAVAPSPRWALGTFLGATLWTLLTLTPIFIASLAAARALHDAWGWPALVAWWWVCWIVVRALVLLTSRTGRRRARAAIERLWRHEFWPAHIFYLPLVPYFLWLAIRHRGIMTWTCANPAIPNGGGIVGESKSAILDALRGASDRVLAGARIPAGPKSGARADQALAILRERSDLGGWPVVLKPNAGERGRAVAVARTEDDLRSYFASHTHDILIQRYHPGPHEIGVFWTRTPEGSGEILSITRKSFPLVTADGKRTLERLVYDHPRYRMQADVFIRELGARRDETPPADERVSLGIAGNHVRGSMFEDGASLRAPALEHAINEIALGFIPIPESGVVAVPSDSGFDFGRFDLRFTDPDSLADGQGFAIVELNGTTSESTNLYDPSRSLSWAYAVLFRQWRTLFKLGRWRRGTGVQPMSLGALLRAWRATKRQ